jgi:hypothetical protein
VAEVLVGVQQRWQKTTVAAEEKVALLSAQLQ